MELYNDVIPLIPQLRSYSFGKFINYPFGQSDLPYFAPNKNTNYLVGVLAENLGKEGPEQFLYRIADDELYIISGLTPPECLYYGYIQYLFRRGDKLLFSSVNDTLNQNIVEYIANRKYRVPSLILISKNPKVMDIAYNFFMTQNLIPFPLIYRIALPTDKFIPEDIFITILRVASIAPGNENYINIPPIAFMKLKFNVTQVDPTNKYCFYQPGQPIVNDPTCKNGFYQRQRDSNINEYSLTGLQRGFNVFTQAVLRSINLQKNLYTSKGCKKCKYDSCKCKKRKPNGPIIIVPPPIVEPPDPSPPQYTEIITQPWGFVKDNNYIVIDTGYNCIENNINCIGDNRDTIYRVSDVIFTDNIDFVVITAINHILTGKGLYCNINVYDNETEESLYNLDVTDTKQLYYYIILKKDVFKLSNGNISKEIIVAERVYLQRFISPSYETTIPYRIFINNV